MGGQVKLVDKWYFRDSLRRKEREFNESGYKTVTQEALWNYCVDYLWPRQKATTRRQQKRVLALITPHAFFDYQQLKAQTKQTTLADMGDLSDLF